MSTLLSLYIKSDNREQIADILQALSGITDRTREAHSGQTRENILMDENALPSIISIGNTHNGWTAVELNSFNRLHDWKEQISKELDTTVIHILGQTVSDVYYFYVYEKGVSRREIEIYHGDYEQVVDKGEKFPFEKSKLVPEDDNDYEDFEIFDMDMVNEYCKRFGFDIFADNEPEHYIILRRKNIGKTILEQFGRAGRSKPWWRFW